MAPRPRDPPAPLSAAEIRGSILFTRGGGPFLFVLVPTVSWLTRINGFIRRLLNLPTFQSSFKPSWYSFAHTLLDWAGGKSCQLRYHLLSSRGGYCHNIHTPGPRHESRTQVPILWSRESPANRKHPLDICRAFGSAVLRISVEKHVKNETIRCRLHDENDM